MSTVGGRGEGRRVEMSLLASLALENKHSAAAVLQMLRLPV